MKKEIRKFIQLYTILMIYWVILTGIMKFVLGIEIDLFYWQVGQLIGIGVLQIFLE